MKQLTTDTRIKMFARMFKVLSSQSGLKILLLLSSSKTICVSDIAQNIRLSMSATSHQLQKIEAAGLVTSMRSGRTICYILNRNEITRDICVCLQHIHSAKIS